jgi:hypothetical protein
MDEIWPSVTLSSPICRRGPLASYVTEPTTPDAGVPSSVR